MKSFKWFFYVLFGTALFSCGGTTDRGELVGVPGRRMWFHPQPFGTVYVPTGSMHIGETEQDVPMAMIGPNKQISVPAFFMDETEITNNEYRQFVYWVRDSIARRTLGEAGNDNFLVSQDIYGEDITPGPQINWEEKLKYTSPEAREGLNDMYLPENERFYRRKENDTRK